MTDQIPGARETAKHMRDTAPSRTYCRLLYKLVQDAWRLGVPADTLEVPLEDDPDGVASLHIDAEQLLGFLHRAKAMSQDQVDGVLAAYKKVLDLPKE